MAHSGWWRGVLAALLAIVMSASLPLAAQTDGPIGGRVMTHDGRPIAGARVTLLGRRLRHGGEPAATLRLDVDADTGGRFHTQVRRDFVWSAFAMVPADGPLWRCTRVSEDLVAGDHLTLVEGSRVAARTAIRLAGTAPWQPLGRLSLRILPEVGLEWTVAVDPDADGSFPLPALPAGPSGHAGVVVVDADGEPLWIDRVPLTPRARRAAGLAPEAPCTIRLPPPQPLRVKVVDDAGAPLAGAAVRYRLGQVQRGVGPRPLDRPFEWIWRGGATSGADGVATLPLAADRPPSLAAPFDLLVVAETAGRALGWSGWVGGRAFRDGRVVAEHGADELRVTLGPPGPAALRLTLDGEPWGDARVRFAAALPVRDGDAELAVVEIEGHARSDGDGRLRLPQLPAGSIVEWLPIDPGGCDEGGSRRPAHATAALVPIGPPRDAGTLDFAAGRELHLTVLDVDDVPAAEARAVVIPAGCPDDHRPLLPWNLRCDSQGRAVLRLPPGAHDLAIVSPRGYAHLRIDADATSLPEIALRPLSPFRVRVVDAGGEPIPDALVHPVRTTTWSFPDPLARRRAMLLTELSRIGLSVWTGPDGRAACRFAPELAGSLRVFTVLDGAATPPETVERNNDERLLRPR